MSSGGKWPILTILVAWLMTSGGAAEADPVTYEFSGRITGVVPDILNSQPPELAVGRSFAGTYTFDDAATAVPPASYTPAPADPPFPDLRAAGRIYADEAYVRSPPPAGYVPLRARLRLQLGGLLFIDSTGFADEIGVTGGGADLFGGFAASFVRLTFTGGADPSASAGAGLGFRTFAGGTIGGVVNYNGKANPGYSFTGALDQVRIVPEPASLALLAVGGAGLLAIARRGAGATA